MTDETATDMPTRAPPKANRLVPRPILDSLRALGLVFAIVVIAAFFQIQNQAFLSPENVLTIVRSMASLAIIAFAQLLVIIAGELDLSVGAVYGLGATTLAVFWLGVGNVPFQLPLVLAIVVALGVGALAGGINAFFTTVVGIPSFIATLGMLSIAAGLELLLSNASSFNPQYNLPPPSRVELDIFRALGATVLPFRIPIQVLWLAVLFGIFWVLRHRTLFGFRLLAVGGNADAARISRLPVRKYKWIVFVLSGVMAVVAGILDFSYVGSVGPGSGSALTFPVFAAVVIGGASLSGGRGTVIGTLIGATLLAVLRNGLAIMGVGAFAGLLFVGIVTIGAVSFDRLAFGRGKS